MRSSPRRARGFPPRALLITVTAALSGCTGPAAQPATWLPPESSASPAAAGPAGTPGRGATPSGSAAARQQPSPSSTRAGKKNRPPVVRSIRAEPGRVDPLSCDPPAPPEQPLVVADVRDPDNSPRELAVHLDYGTGGGSYQGTVRMTYSAGRRSFVYRLPPVTAAAVGHGTISIGISVWADDGGPSTGPASRPVSAAIPFASPCGNG